MAVAFRHPGVLGVFQTGARAAGAPPRVYCRSLEPKGTLPYVDLEDEDLEEFGVGKLEDFTWKDLLDAQACVRCGRCELMCPAHASGKPLSPKDLMQSLDAHLSERGPIVLAQRKAEAAQAKVAGSESGSKEGGAPAVAFEPTEQQQAVLDKALVGDVISPEALWSCTTCGACMEACPALLEHVPKTVGMRTYQVSMESAFPSEATSTFRSLETNGNPWGLGMAEPLVLGRGAGGARRWPMFRMPSTCTGPVALGRTIARNRKVSRALVALLQHAGVRFAVIGNEEKCCGDAARRLGNEFVYYQLATENIETLKAYGAKKIIVQCPHCAHVIERDYPQLGGTFEVVRHVELLERLVREGKLGCTAGMSSRLPVRVRYLSRLVLSGSLCGRVRRAACIGDRQRRARGGDGAHARTELLLRRGRRAHVARGARGPAHQRHANRPGACYGRGCGGNGVPVLPCHVRGRVGGTRRRRSRKRRGGTSCRGSSIDIACRRRRRILLAAASGRMREGVRGECVALRGTAGSADGRSAFGDASLVRRVGR